MMLILRAGSPTLRIDGVLHDIADVAVLPQREPFACGLRWTLVFEGPDFAPLVASAQALPRGRPSRADASRLLGELRALLMRYGDGPPRFSLNTIDEIDVGPARVRLAGTCSLIVPEVAGGLSPRV